MGAKKFFSIAIIIAMLFELIPAGMAFAQNQTADGKPLQVLDSSTSGGGGVIVESSATTFPTAPPAKPLESDETPESTATPEPTATAEPTATPPGERTYSITVTVTAGDTGLPLENATVVIYPSGSAPDDDDAITAAHTLNGRYFAEGFVNGTYLILASAEGYLPAPPVDVIVHNANIDMDDGIVLEKDTSVIYGGVVTDARGTALADMTVVARESGTEAIISTVTDGEGNYSLPLDSVKEYKLSVIQYGKLYKGDILIANPQATQSANISLDGYFLTYGSLLDSSLNAAKMTDDGIIGERRFAVNISGIPQAITANADGEFRFLGEEGPCTITIPSQGQFFKKTYEVPDCSDLTEPIQIVLEQITQKVVVVDESQNPIRFIKYKVLNENVKDGKPLVFERPAASATGEFIISELDADAVSIQLIVESEGYAPETVSVVLKETKPAEDITVVLKKGKVYLHIKDPMQNPISGCRVITDVPSIIVSGIGSTFTLSNVPVGQKFSICISKNEYATQVFNTIVTSAQERTLTCFLTTLVSTQTGTLTGKIKSGDGSPLKDVLVRVGDWFTYTDTNGNYTFTQLPLLRSLDISATKEGYVSYCGEDVVRFSSDSLTMDLPDITLPEAKSITINVRAADTNAAITNAKVMASGAESFYSDTPGEYVIVGLAQGIHQVSVSADGYLSTVKSISTDTQSDVYLTSAPITDTNIVEGYVLNSGGTPLSGALVSVGSQNILSDFDGYFRLGNVSPLLTTMSVSKSGYESQTVSIQFDSSYFYSETLLKQSNATSGRIKVMVKTKSGEPIEGATADLCYIGGDGSRRIIHSGTTGASGLFTIFGLESGVTYQIRISKAGYTSFEGGFKADSDATHDIRLAPAGTCTLTVTDINSQPIAGADCYVPSLNKHYITDEQGTVVIDSLLYDTDYNIYIYAENYMPSSIVRKTTQEYPNPSVTVKLSPIPAGKAIISGTVTDKNTGTPIAGAIVSCLNPSVKVFTDENGRYTLPGLTQSADQILITVSKDNYSFVSTEFTVLYSENTLDLTTERTAGTITGTIVDSYGNPIEGVNVSCSGSSATTLSDGTYTLNGVWLSSSSIAVYFSKLNYIDQTLNITLSKTNPSGILNGVLKRKSSVTIELQNVRTGEIITDATVFLYPKDVGDPISNKITLELVGSLFKKEVSEGRYDIGVNASGYRIPNLPEITVPIDAAGNPYVGTIRLTKIDDPKGPGPGPGGIGGGIYNPPATSSPSPSPTPTPTPTATPDPSGWTGFEDMSDPNISWAVQPVMELTEVGVIAKDRLFRPNDNIKREEFIKLLVTAFNWYDASAQCSFIDASPSDWYYPYVASAAQVGILVGYEDGSFGAGQYISRQDIATLCFRASHMSGKELPAIKEPKLFTDQELIASYAQIAVGAMQCAGIINGLGDGSFAPLSNATRAQAAKMIHGLWKLP